MGGGDDKKEGNALASASAKTSRDEHAYDRASSIQNQLETRGQIASSRGQAVNDMTNVRSRDYNTFNNPYIGQAAGDYRNFATTGGVSEGDANLIRRNARAGISGTYGRMMDESNRRASVQGGYGPGREALASRLQRDRVAAISQSGLGAEQAIMQQRFQGRMFGTQGTHGLGQQTADRTLQRDATVMGANQNMLDSDRTAYGDAYRSGIAERGLTHGTQIDSANTLRGNSPNRDWLGTSLAIGSAVGSGVGMYYANR